MTKIETDTSIETGVNRKGRLVGTCNPGAQRVGGNCVL